MIFNSSALKNAMRRNMSIWRTHTGPDKRKVFVRKASAPRHEQFASFDDEEEEIQEEDEDENSQNGVAGMVRFYIIILGSFDITNFKIGKCILRRVLLLKHLNLYCQKGPNANMLLDS